MRGLTVPRLWTPPLRELTPETSYGFELIEFAEEAGSPLDDWQRWLAIHSGELLPDGRPRFRIVLVLVSRQNGKTHYGKVLSAYWLHVDLPGMGERPTVLGISSKLDYAKEAFMATVNLCRSSPLLAPEIPSNGLRESNGEQTLTTTHGTRYKIAASNDDAGRSLTVSRLLVDELRRQTSWSAWSAAEPTTASVPDAQIIALTNQGGDEAVVLDSLRKSALEFIETGQGDPRLGIFEWSAPDGSDPTDVQALAQSNPNLNHPSGRNPLDALMGNAIRAKAAGGEQLAKFRTESMCMRVHVMDPAIDPDKWALCADPKPIPDELRNRVALALDVSLDMRHATLVAAAVLPDGKVRVEVVKAWYGEGCTAQLRADLPGIVRGWKVKPRTIGWLPAGPAAAIAADLTAPKKRTHGTKWPPPGVKVEEIRGDTAAICMGLAELVEAKQIAHPDDQLLNQHIAAAQKLKRGDAWVYARQGTGPIDGSYATAAAVHLARTMPTLSPKPKLVVAGQGMPNPI